MAIDQAFNATIDYYDDWIRKAVPGYDDMFAIARELLPFPEGAEVDVLDLGAGTGLFSRLVLGKYPRSRFVLVDVAEKMLDVARERFRDHPGQFGYRVEDYRDLREEGRYDLVISALSIHHLADPEKRTLFARVHAALRDGGIFLNIDQIRGGDPGAAGALLRHLAGQGEGGRRLGGGSAGGDRPAPRLRPGGDPPRSAPVARGGGVRRCGLRLQELSDGALLCSEEGIACQQSARHGPAAFAAGPFVFPAPDCQFAGGGYTFPCDKEGKRWTSQ